MLNNDIYLKSGTWVKKKRKKFLTSFCWLGYLDILTQFACKRTRPVWHMFHHWGRKYINFNSQFAKLLVGNLWDNDITIYNTHTEVHRKTGRGLPDQILQYKHGLLMYKLVRNCIIEEEFVQMNFQATPNPRSILQNFIKNQYYSNLNVFHWDHNKTLNTIFIWLNSGLMCMPQMSDMIWLFQKLRFQSSCTYIE